MSYTVRQVARMSQVSVRTLHFYDETGLLKPAYYGTNGYRFYDEPQLLMLQQILFYRELGFELKRIKEVLGRAKFQKVAALKSHRKVLEKKLGRMRTLIETIDKTLSHLKGVTNMKSEELFAGFSVAAGDDRSGKRITLRGEPIACKVSGQDTGGTTCVFECTANSGGPQHLHDDQDEWIYVVDGELQFQIGNKRSRVGAGESVFIPRKTAHRWASGAEGPAKIINMYQPAGRMEDFFREVAKYNDTAPVHEVLTLPELHSLFQDHGMELVGSPLGWIKGRQVSRHKTP